MTTWLNDSGGIRYHLRGAFSARTRWASFRMALSAYLRQWLVSGEELVIVGPSAGWCLEPGWLTGFRRLVCVDPDPLARALFGLRMNHRAVTWVRTDYFTTCDADGFSALLGRHSGAPVLFANFLGQLRLLVDDRREDEVLGYWKRRLEPALAGRAFASFHDRFSGALAPLMPSPLESGRRLDDRELVARAFEAGARGELFDHLTEGFFRKDAPHAYFSWELAPRRWHLVEATRSSGKQS